MLNTDKISIFDSRMSGSGQATMAIKAKEMAQAGASRPEIIQTLEDIQRRTHTFIIVESLRYLYEGGRLTGAQALIGSLVQIKPIIWFDNNGKLVTFEKARTLKTAKSRILEIIQEQINQGSKIIALHYGDNYGEAVDYAQQLESLTDSPVSLTQISPVLATHTGPDVLGVVLIEKEEKAKVFKLNRI